MQVMVLSPRKVLLAGAISALLVAGSVMGALALWGVFRDKPAVAYGIDGIGARRWIFPEGYTGPGFEEWILIYNPSTAEGGSGLKAAPEIRMYGPSGFIGTYTFPALQPGERRSVNINEAAALYGYSGDISVVVHVPLEGSASEPFLCERAMYFNYKGQITGGSQVFGYQEGENE